MSRVRRFALCLLLLLAGQLAQAESRVFSLVTAQPQEVAETVRALYGDQVTVQVINQRLAVVGSAGQVAQIAELVAQLDRVPATLRLTLSEDPPIDEITGSVYRTGAQEYRIDTVEGAMVELEAVRLGQRAATDGWLVLVDEVPVHIRSLVLNVRLQRDEVLVTYSFTRRDEGERQVYGNRRAGALGQWMPLLPKIGGSTPNTYSTEAADRRGQLYLRVERIE